MSDCYGWTMTNEQRKLIESWLLSYAGPMRDAVRAALDEIEANRRCIDRQDETIREQSRRIGEQAAAREAMDEIARLRVADKVATETARLAVLELKAARQTAAGWFATAQEQAETIVSLREQLEAMRIRVAGTEARED